MSWFEASARWYGTLILLTWAFAPLVRLLCGGLADRGVTIARPLALLGVVYPLWFLASLNLLPYSTVGLWITAALAALVGWGIAVLRGYVTFQWLKSLLLVELLSISTFAAYVWMRGFTPEIENTEKPMDAAFLASSARTESMPPADPWFAGEPINYYYAGYLLHGALARLAAVPASVAFNLALATTISMAAVAAAGAAYNVARLTLRRRRALIAGGLAALFLVVLGNLYAPLRLLQAGQATYDAPWWSGIGWPSSRVICDVERVDQECPNAGLVIDEFPYFSFLLGDLHPHVTGLPFTVVALILALNLFVLARRHPRSPLGHRDVAVIAVSGVIVGSLYVLNSWDYPTYLLIAAVALYVGLATFTGRERWLGVGVLVATSLVAWLPFWLTFVPFAGADASTLPAALRDIPGVARALTTVTTYGGERTSVGEFLTIFGVPFVFACWFLGTKLIANTGWLPSGDTGRLMAAGGIVVVVGALFLPMPLLVLCGAPFAVAVLILRHETGVTIRTVATALYAAGFGLLILTEFFYIEDTFQSRMNTVFKVYFQVWTLFALATALAVVVLWRERQPRAWARSVLAAALFVAIGAGLVYPLLATYRWTNEFDRWRGLDGIAYVGDADPEELAAIRWLTENAGADDIMLQGTGCGYFQSSRVAAFSGVPTVIGWSNHERQWRSGQPALFDQIAIRQEDVRTMYAEPSSPLFDAYGVTLLYVGRYEQETAEPKCAAADPVLEAVSPSFPGDGWREVFAEGDVHIYRRA